MTRTRQDMPSPQQVPHSATIAFRYLENLYLSESDLYRGQQVTADEAEPTELPNPLPRKVHLVSEEFGVFTNFAEAFAALLEADAANAAVEIDDYYKKLCPPVRLFTLELDALGQRYELTGVTRA